MKFIYFSFASLLLGGATYGTEVHESPTLPHHQASPHRFHSGSFPVNRLDQEAKQERIPSRSIETSAVAIKEADKKMLVEEIARYKTIVEKLESAGPKISETIKAHHKTHKEALEALMKYSEIDSNIHIKEELFHITQKYNMFSGGY